MFVTNLTLSSSALSYCCWRTRSSRHLRTFSGVTPARRRALADVDLHNGPLAVEDDVDGAFAHRVEPARFYASFLPTCLRTASALAGRGEKHLDAGLASRIADAPCGLIQHADAEAAGLIVDAAPPLGAVQRGNRLLGELPFAGGQTPGSGRRAKPPFALVHASRRPPASSARHARRIPGTWRPGWERLREPPGPVRSSASGPARTSLGSSLLSSRSCQAPTALPAAGPSAAIARTSSRRSCEFVAVCRASVSSGTTAVCTSWVERLVIWSRRARAAFR